jgi:hypothetical protein
MAVRILRPLLIWPATRIAVQSGGGQAIIWALALCPILFVIARLTLGLSLSLLVLCVYAVLVMMLRRESRALLRRAELAGEPVLESASVPLTILMVGGSLIPLGLLFAELALLARH